MKNSRILNYALITLAVVACALHVGASAGPGTAVFAALLVAFVLLAMFGSPRFRSMVRTSNVDANLNLNTILDAAIFAFRRAVLPLTAFSTVFRNVKLQGTDTVAVPFYPLVGGASTDFNGSYVFNDDNTTQGRTVVVNKRKYQPISVTSREISRLPQLNLENIGRIAGEKLAFDVCQDILSVFVNANYVNKKVLSAANYDADAITDLRTVLGNANWPEAGRALIANPDMDGALLKDNSFRNAYAIGNAQAITTGRLPDVLGFKYAMSNAIPGNNENLIGLAVHPSAALVAFSPIEPTEEVRQRLTRYEIVTDELTGISIEFRQWGTASGDATRMIIESNYGYDKGDEEGVFRLVAA